MSFPKIEITIIVENTVKRRDLLAEHGLSFYISCGQKRYIFDVGQGLALKNNLEQLNINTSGLDGVIISHGHYDHGGGLETILADNPQLMVYSHPDIFKMKYSKRDNCRYEKAGISLTVEDINNYTPVKGWQEIASGVWVINQFPQFNKFEGIDEKYRVGEEKKPDNFSDESILLLESGKGLIVILGCSHVGVVNILEYIKREIDKEISAVIGGMHLVNADEERISRTIKELSAMEINHLIPLHCSGDKFIRELSLQRENIITVNTGDKLILT